MKTKSYFFLTALFLAAQILSLLHMAEHGFEKHEHDGQICGVYLHSEHTKNADAAKPAIVPTIVFTEASLHFFSPVLLSKDILSGVSTRGPPTFILS